MSDTEPPPLAEFVGNGDWALFLDFDGTLVALATTPDAIHVPQDLPRVLQDLERVFAGAVAIVTGRSLQDLDRHLPTVNLPAAGQHGAEYRLDIHQAAAVIDARILDSVRFEIGAFASRNPGVLVEDKGAAIALHYRCVPDAEAVVKQQVEAWVAASEAALEYLKGKCVCEIRLAGASKGQALRRFMNESVFRGRRPLVLGDDVTDEAAFEVAQALGGAAIKVGEGRSCANWRLTNPETVREWLRTFE